MDRAGSNTLPFKRANFSTQLPLDYLYSPSHFWIAASDGDRWKIGLTKFASRMLGEMVDFRFDIAPGNAVAPGQILGWIEGFKAISDIYCIANGQFVGANPLLQTKIKLVNQDGYRQGWLYEIDGQPDAQCLEVRAYAEVLNKTIDKILERQKNSAPP